MLLLPLLLVFSAVQSFVCMFVHLQPASEWGHGMVGWEAEPLLLPLVFGGAQGLGAFVCPFPA